MDQRNPQWTLHDVSCLHSQLLLAEYVLRVRASAPQPRIPAGHAPKDSHMGVSMRAGKTQKSAYDRSRGLDKRVTLFLAYAKWSQDVTRVKSKASCPLMQKIVLFENDLLRRSVGSLS